MLKFEIVQFDSLYCINLSSFLVWYSFFFHALFRRNYCLNLYILFFLPNLLCFMFLFLVFNLEYNHSYSITVYFQHFTISYIHMLCIRSAFSDICCLKGLSALLCAEQGEHKDIVSLLSKCLNVWMYKLFSFFLEASCIFAHIPAFYPSCLIRRGQRRPGSRATAS